MATPARMFLALIRLPHVLLNVLRPCLPGLLAACAGTALAQPAAPLQLERGQGLVDAWPALRMLADPEARLGRDAVLARRAELGVPDGPQANLGLRRGAVWLHLPLAVRERGHWVLQIDHPPLEAIDVHVLADGRPIAEHHLGSLQPFDRRGLNSRAPALALPLQPAVRYEVLLRVQSRSSLLVPVTLQPVAAFVAAESLHVLLQGLFLGVTLALMISSALRGLALRDPQFGCYALMLVGLVAFFLNFEGLGHQHLWNAPAGPLLLLGDLGILLALAGGSLFIVGALQARTLHPRVARGLQAIAAAATLCFLLGLVGVLDYAALQAASTVLGPLPLLLGLAAAASQARRGSRAAALMLLGWSGYIVGALGLAALVHGWVPANAFTQHLFQAGVMIDMLAWMRVLGLREEALQRAAGRALAEREALEALAYSDALTGLPNRRGLEQALARALAGLGAGGGLAVYLLDLDGFKPVNDALGHDVGDTLLVQLAQRLRTRLRGEDVVARLGGDEFVVVARGIDGEASARLLGEQLLAVVDAPFDLGAARCRVGLTIGYALAPQDGTAASVLLRRADQAMYAGKQDGRGCLRRCSAEPVAAAALPASATGRPRAPAR